MADRNFKFFRIFPLALAAGVVLVAGCAGVPARHAGAASEQPLARLNLNPDDAQAEVLTRVLAGEFALQDGNMAAASRDYAAAAAQSPDPAVARQSADLALAQGDRAAAGAAIQRMQATHANAGDLLATQAAFALLKGHRDEARGLMQRIVAPGTRDAWRQVAQLLSDARDPALAGVLLQELATPATLPAKDTAVWVAMSQLGVKLRRPQWAADLADTAAARFDDAAVLAWDAHLKLEAGDAAASAALLQRAVKAHPDDARLRLAWAAALGKLGDNRTAAEVLADGPQTLDTYGARAAYCARAGDQAGMRQVYDELVADAGQLGDAAAFLIAQLADARGDQTDALAWYARVPLDDDHYFDATARRAGILAQQGADGQAKAHALAAQLIDESDGDDDSLLRALLLDAQLYSASGDAADAVAAYDRGLQRLPKSKELLYGRALSRADAGQIDGSIADLRTLLQRDPDNVDAMNALGYTLADGNRDLPEAEQLLKRALKAKPDEPAVIDSWGWLQYRLGHLDVAEAALRRAWDKLKDPDIGTHFGEVLWQRGKRAEAQRVFAAVRKLDPHSAVLARALKRLQP